MPQSRAATQPGTCCASSRVGASTTEYGPSASMSGLPSMGGCFSMYTSIGSTKAAVLPEPVSAEWEAGLCDHGLAGRATGASLMFTASGQLRHSWGTAGAHGWHMACMPSHGLYAIEASTPHPPAMPMTSLNCSPSGMAAIWMGEGFL